MSTLGTSAVFLGDSGKNVFTSGREFINHFADLFVAYDKRWRKQHVVANITIAGAAHRITN